VNQQYYESHMSVLMWINVTKNCMLVSMGSDEIKNHMPIQMWINNNTTNHMSILMWIDEIEKAIGMWIDSKKIG
jgi:hypothetical protein